MHVITWDLPEWVQPLLDGSRSYTEPAERMQFVVDLARRNVDEGTGGPFGAAVFRQDSWKLVSVGVNRVVPSGCSHAHAEMLAMAQAQSVFEAYDLGAPGVPPLELASSCEPCAMCFGAIPWSGIRSVSCGASDEDARSIGFDEGPKPPDWADALRRRGIEVRTGVCHDEAKAVLLDYEANGGTIYNGTRPGADSG